MAKLQPRREVWEYGSLPVSVLCPHLDAPGLLLAHSKLLSKGKTGEGGEREYCRWLERMQRTHTGLSSMDCQCCCHGLWYPSQLTIVCLLQAP